MAHVHGVCPWWIGYLLVNPLRRLVQDPKAILAPYLRPGLTVVEPGPGMGFFTLELARGVGPSGHVVAVDVQPRMLAALTRRAHRAGLADRIEARLAAPDGLGLSALEGRVDLVVAFYVVHEFPDEAAFFREAARLLAPGGRLLVAEPRGHVGEADFSRTLERARVAGLAERGRPAIWRSWTALLAPAT